jgi:hypothetical protein
MKNWQFGVLAGLLVAILAVHLIPIISPSRAQPSWEYMIESPGDEHLRDEINASGDVGWELVFARRAVGEGKASYEMIYKRPK